MNAEHKDKNGLCTAAKQSTLQHPSWRKSRVSRGTSYRVFALGLSVYALVVFLMATNVAHPSSMDDHSSKRFFKDFMQGFSSSLSNTTSVNKQTPTTTNTGTTVINNDPARKRITVKVEVTQESQIRAMFKLAEVEEKQRSLERKENLVEYKNHDKKDVSTAPGEFTFPAHGCLTNNKVLGGEKVYCHFQNLRINKTRIFAGRLGGEPLASVMGQDESLEYLAYQHGAFILQSTLDPPYPSEWYHQYYYMNNVRQAIEYENTTTTASTKCDQVFVGLTLFITRYEYANLYHTMTDWWNAFYSLPVDKRMTNNNVNVEKVNVIFLDAHPEGNLDPAWEQLFGTVTYVRHLPSENACFEQARFVPPGYTSPLLPRNGGSIFAHGGSVSRKKQRDATDFVEHVLNAYNLSHIHRIPGHVVVIDRVQYTSHARSNPSQTERVLDNIQELALNLPSLLFPMNVTVQVVTLVNDTMRDQIAAIRQADVLVANHGAGLTHLLFLDTNAHVVELSCNNAFFLALAQWRREIHHHCQEGPEGSMSEEYWHRHVVSVVRRAVLGQDSVETI